MPRKIFGRKAEELARESKRIHNEELHNLNATPNIIRVINSSRMRWAGHVARVGRREMHTNIGRKT
jgi:hypothetical protein